tara:strand:- start:26229 stop:26912 length:684 start_codon:yes stop_codon:yes gene_type:complete
MTIRNVSRISLGLSLVLVLGALGCEGHEDESEGDTFPSEIDLELFAQPVSFNDLELQGLLPASPAAYIELRKQGLSSSEFTIVTSSGEKCGDDADQQACEASFDAMPVASEGFYYVEHPDDKFHYLAATQAGASSTVTSAAEMKQFLGTIDNRAEALLLAAAQGYNWNASELSEGAVRETANGFELIVTQTNLCPIVTTGFLISVSTGGETAILNQWIARPDEGFCS